MRHFLICFLLIIITCPAIAQTQGIAVVVNDDVISSTDVNDRLRLIMASAGFPNEPEVVQKLLPQITNALIEEQLKIQEANREGVSVTDEEVMSGFAQIAAQNKLEPEQFQAMMSQAGINFSTLQRQISSQLLWAKVVQKKLRPQININDNDVDAFIDRIKENAGKNEYLVSEILIDVPNDADEVNVKGFAHNLVAQMRAGKAPFFKMAQQFSKSAGAMKGGDLGWIQEDQIAEGLVAPLQAMEEAGISDPIRTPAGYHILLLRNKREISEEAIPDREQIITILGTQRLERMQEHLLNELKASAYIDSRV